MFLRNGILACLAIVLMSGGMAFAQGQIPGLRSEVYKLKSMTKDFRGKRLESKADRDKFCGETVHPSIREDSGILDVELNSGIGFEWREINEIADETSDGCRYSTLQKIESGRARSSVMLINGEECTDGKSVIGSQRETWDIGGDEIVYQVESVAKDRSGRWQVLRDKEGFTCIWRLSK